MFDKYHLIKPLAASLLIVFASPQENRIVPDDIVERMLADALQDNADKLEGFTFLKHYLEENLNDDGSVKSKEKDELYLVSGENGRGLEKILERNGKKIDENDAEGKLSDNNFDFYHVLSKKYRFAYSDAAPLDYSDPASGRRLRLVSLDFFPKEGLEIEGKEDRILNYMNGRVYIDAELNIWKIAARLPEEISVFGFLGAVYALETELHYTQIGSTMVPHQSTVTAKYRKLFWARNKKFTITYRDFKPRD